MAQHAHWAPNLHLNPIIEPMNLFIALAFVAILGALLFAGITMVRQPTDARKTPSMMRALALRVALSIALFVGIWLAYALGWIEPRGL